ncbi:hypothetical protein H4R34_005159, partial [Dimargaris verticillata]
MIVVTCALTQIYDSTASSAGARGRQGKAASPLTSPETCTQGPTAEFAGVTIESGQYVPHAVVSTIWLALQGRWHAMAAEGTMCILMPSGQLDRVVPLDTPPSRHHQLPSLYQEVLCRLTDVKPSRSIEVEPLKYMETAQGRNPIATMQHLASTQGCAGLLSLSSVAPGKVLQVTIVYRDILSLAVCHFGNHLTALGNILLSTLAQSDVKGSPPTVSDHEWLSPVMRKQVIHLGSAASPTDTVVKVGPPESFLALFNDQVMQHPDELAVCHGKHTMTYHDLGARVASLVYYLQSQYNVTPSSRVALFGQRSIELTVAMLAVTMAGGAF